MNKQLPKAVEDCHKLIIWLIPKLDQFPRNRRYTLGEKIESGVLELLQSLLDATYTRNRGSSLEAANRQLALLKHLWRIAYELKVIAHKAYQYGGTLMVDLGRQIGGWRKATKI